MNDIQGTTQLAAFMRCDQDPCDVDAQLNADPGYYWICENRFGEGLSSG